MQIIPKQPMVKYAGIVRKSVMLPIREVLSGLPFFFLRNSTLGFLYGRMPAKSLIRLSRMGIPVFSFLKENTFG